MKETKQIQPTNAELEVLEILWQKKKASVREVYDTILLNKECVYTSTLKIMQKMQTKGLIGRTVDNQKHEYYALVEEANVRNTYVQDMINKFFKGSYSNLALHALGNSEKGKNVDELIELVNKLKQDKN
ncbi:MAG TPA: BlaI/MecI/CopY family transcriptional regulator [Mucilaginibacter sp.]|jgi:predicted transcriptional regulator